LVSEQRLETEDKMDDLFLFVTRFLSPLGRPFEMNKTPRTTSVKKFKQTAVNPNTFKL